MKRALHILSPCDRFNYGDLIFAHIITNYFHDFVDEIHYYSTKKSDLSQFGSIPTDGFSSLFKVDKSVDNFLIVAGGDSLCIDWQTILSFIDRSSQFFYIIDNKFKINFFSTLYNRLLYHATTYFPFSVCKKELPNFKGVFYNSVGGSFLDCHPDFLSYTPVLDILNDVDYLSVRDKFTCELLNSNNISSILVPDSAILMSEVFSDSFLNIKSAYNKNNLKNKYIFFQINSKYGIGREKFYADVLNRVCHKFGFSLCLCPIGLAPGHSDHIPLNNIKKFMDKDIDMVFVDNPNVWNIMYLIKSSALYIGTSLHGAITSMSFSVPYLVHGPNKLKNYVDTWDSANSKYFVNDRSCFDKILLSRIYDTSIPDATIQKNFVVHSFDSIKEMIKNNG